MDTSSWFNNSLKLITELGTTQLYKTALGLARHSKQALSRFLLAIVLSQIFTVISALSLISTIGLTWLFYTETILFSTPWAGFFYLSAGLFVVTTIAVVYLINKTSRAPVTALDRSFEPIMVALEHLEREYGQQQRQTLQEERMSARLKNLENSIALLAEAVRDSKVEPINQRPFNQGVS